MIMPFTHDVSPVASAAPGHETRHDKLYKGRVNHIAATDRVEIVQGAAKAAHKGTHAKSNLSKGTRFN
jgi:hypothetical protein